MLNKKVGNKSRCWRDRRQAYCRIYDPRNFEFEITIENLLYILEYSNSIKGRGLEGEFVYVWDGKNLLLMPVEAPDYKIIAEYNNIVHSNVKIKAKNLIVGATYLTKDNQEFIYMGKFDYYSCGYRWMENGRYVSSNNLDDIPTISGRFEPTRIPYERIDYLYGKYYWFAYKHYDSEYDFARCETIYKNSYKWKFEQYRSFPKNKFISCSDNKCSKEYSDIYEQMICTNNFSPRDSKKDVLVPYTYEEFERCVNEDRNQHNRFFSDNQVKYKISYDDKTDLWTVGYASWGVDSKDRDADFYNRFDFIDVEVSGHYFWETKRFEKKIVPMTLKELYKKLRPCYKEIYLANGKLFDRESFYSAKA